MEQVHFTTYNSSFVKKNNLLTIKTIPVQFYYKNYICLVYKLYLLTIKTKPVQWNEAYLYCDKSYKNVNYT